MGVDARDQHIPSLPPWLIEELDEHERAHDEARRRPELHIERHPLPEVPPEARPPRDDEGVDEASSRVIIIPL